MTVLAAARQRACPPPRALAATLVLVALLGAACGSYTKRDFVAQANAICVKAIRQTRLLPPPSNTGVSAAAARRSLASYLAKVVPILRSEAHQLGALRRPSQGAAQRAALARYLTALRRSVSGFDELRSAAAHGSVRGVTAAEHVLAGVPVTTFAASYGLSSCASPGATIR